ASRTRSKGARRTSTSTRRRISPARSAARSRRPRARRSAKAAYGMHAAFAPASSDSPDLIHVERHLLLQAALEIGADDAEAVGHERCADRVLRELIAHAYGSELLGLASDQHEPAESAPVRLR